LNANNFLEEKGLFIEDTKEYAFNKEDALYYSELLYNEKEIILGGDVYVQDESTKELVPTYENWYIDIQIMNVKNGYEYAKQYIQEYDSSEFTYFVIVL